MVDIHCHILPGVDDGADSVGTALEMAQMASDSGVSAIIATPHCGADFLQQNYKSAQLLDAFQRFREEIESAHIPIKLYTGVEVLCTDETPGLLSSGKLLTLASSRYLLVEFYFDAPPEFMNIMLDIIDSNGCVPVIAHPERYDVVQRYPGIVHEWYDNGYVIQINKGSILGKLGQDSQMAARWILSNGLAHVVASDAHSSIRRTTDMNYIRHHLGSELLYGYAELLLNENPRRIINNKPVISIRDMIEPEEY